MASKVDFEEMETTVTNSVSDGNRGLPGKLGLDRSESGSKHLVGATSVIATARSSFARQLAQEERAPLIILPWTKGYSAWWALTLICSVVTVFTETYQIAFVPAGLSPPNEPSSILEFILYSVFFSDMVVNFNLAYYNEANDIVSDRESIAKNYIRSMFWVDFLGVFPFYPIALAITGELGEDSELAQYLALFRLFKMARLHRVKQFFDILQYDTHVSLMWLTLIRNFGLALVWTHLNACVMFFISRQFSHDEDETWIGGSLSGLTSFEKYVLAQYWSITTFTTVGYGDFSPVNWAEQIWGMIYMLSNMIITAYIIGSITLLIVKNDEKTGAYRETLKVLDQYCKVNGFDYALQKRLEEQIKLDFGNNEIGDEQVLRHFPSSVRRKILRKLYLPSLTQTSLMKDVRQQFIDEFLAICSVEIFNPCEEILQRGSTASELYLLVGGVVELRPSASSTEGTKDDGRVFGSVADSELASPRAPGSGRQLSTGDFINEIGFFTESPQVDTVRTLTVVKTLTISRSAYKMLADDHPGSASKILNNLLAKVEDMAGDMGSVDLPKKLEVLRAGSVYDEIDPSADPSSHAADVHNAVTAVQKNTALVALQDLVKMHIEKQKDDHTTRFLFAASRGDTATIELMYEHGFDPNSADYDRRTALMVSSMKGNTEVVTKILDYEANPNLVDMHGSSALYEAAKNSHEDTMDVLLKYGASLCMDDSLAASTLCQSVSEGNILMLKRLLRANIQVNASDYDSRTAAHIAAAEGNVAALKVLVEFGADVTARDRWNFTIRDEAKRVNASQVLDYLDSL